LTKEIAETLGIRDSGYKFVINVGSGAGQVIFHLLSLIKIIPIILRCIFIFAHQLLAGREYELKGEFI
jgi:hypothetical protein